MQTETKIHGCPPGQLDAAMPVDAMTTGRKPRDRKLATTEPNSRVVPEPAGQSMINVFIESKDEFLCVHYVAGVAAC